MVLVKKLSLVWMKLMAERLEPMYEMWLWQKILLAVEWHFPFHSVSVRLLA